MGSLLTERRTLIWSAVVVVGVVWTYTLGIEGPVSFKAQLTVAGLGVGAIYALAGLGLVLTYKSTGVFNFAHGAIGVFVAYANFQLNELWGVPVAISAFLSIGVVAPGVGMLLERAVFRPLQRRGATTTEKLVATLGVFVLLVGLIVTRYTAASKVGPSIFPRDTIELPGSVLVGWDVLLTMILLALIAVGLYVLFNRTPLGLSIRAVVDKPELAELASINANRVSSISWAIGAMLGGLSGVLFAAGQLDPFRLTLLMLETLSVAVLARLTSVPLAITTGVLVLGLGRTLFGAVQVFEDPTGVIPETFNQLKPNFATIVLFIALLVYTRLDTVGEAAEQSGRLVNRVNRPRALRLGLVTTAGLVVLPLFLDGNGFDAAHRFLAFTVIFASIVTISGFAGQITLGAAGFAGLGAFAAARMANEFDVPVILAMLFGGTMSMLGGFVAGWPALKRRGLFLALTTVAFGLFIYAFVLSNTTFAGDVTGLDVRRPTLLWWDLSGSTAFYYFELVVVGAMLALARNLRSGRLGRALAAIRDSEPGATSLGIDLRRYKMFIFAVSSFMAGIGGAMLTQQAETFNALQFFPLESLFWFAVVVVAGISSIGGAVVGAFVWVMLDRVIDVNGVSQLVIGAGALLLGRLPGGNLVGLVRVGYESLLEGGRHALAGAMAPPAPPRPRYEANDLARVLVERRPEVIASSRGRDVEVDA